MKPGSLKIRLILIAVILLALCAFLLYFYFSYPIDSSKSNLLNAVYDQYNSGREIEQSPEITIYDDFITIGKEEYHLLNVDGKFGSIALQKGLTGRYKITHCGYGSGDFLDGIAENSGQKYLILGGRDPYQQISTIAVELENNTYKLHNAAPKKHFLLYTKIDDSVTDNHVERDKIELYDEKGENITHQYDLSGGGI